MSAKELPGGQTQVLNVPWIKRIDCHPAESDEDSAPDSILDTENWLDWNGDFDNPNDSEDDWEVDNESNMELANRTRDPETPAQWEVNAAPNVPGVILPTRRSMAMTDKVLMTANTIETRKNKGNKKK